MFNKSLAAAVVIGLSSASIPLTSLPVLAQGADRQAPPSKPAASADTKGTKTTTSAGAAKGGAMKGGAMKGGAMKGGAMKGGAMKGGAMKKK